MNFLNRGKATLKLFIQGSKMIYTDFNFLLKTGVISKPTEKLTYHEVEKLRLVSNSIIKVLPLAIYQIPPLIGYVLLFRAFTHSRKLLPKYYWSSDDKILFLQQEFDDRKFKASKLLNLKSIENLTQPPLGNEYEGDIEGDIPPPPSNYNNRHKPNFRSKINSYKINSDIDPLEFLKDRQINNNEISKLYESLFLGQSPLVLNFLPAYFKRQQLLNFAKHIVVTDHLLTEDILKSLSMEELRHAALLRGMNPCISEELISKVQGDKSILIALYKKEEEAKENIKKNINTWKNSLTNIERQTILDAPSLPNSYSSVAKLLYKIAYNSINTN